MTIRKMNKKEVEQINELGNELHEFILKKKPNLNVALNALLGLVAKSAIKNEIEKDLIDLHFSNIFRAEMEDKK